MQALTERFEMRLDQATLRAVDNWRSQQSDVPSRAEAIRRLMEVALASGGGDEVRFSKGEMLITHLLCELLGGLKIKTELDPEFIQSVLYGGHLWALRWQYSGLFPRHKDDPGVVSEVVDILDMWRFIEEAHANLSKKDKDRVAREADPFGKDPKFFGFDGNFEAEHLHIADFLIRDLKRFTAFEGRELNSHVPTLSGYRKQLEIFLPLRPTLGGTKLSADQIIRLLNAGHSE